MPIDSKDLIPSLWDVQAKPSPTNTWPLGSPSLAWSNLYLGPNGANAFDPTTGNIGFFGKTAAETAASATIVNSTYAPGVVDRYGTNTIPGTTDMTTALQAAINQAAKGGSKVHCRQTTYAITQDLIGSVGTFPLQGGSGPFAIDIEGEGREQTLIQAIGGGAGFTNAMLYFNATPFRLTGSVSGIRFDGGALTTDGIVFAGCDMPNVSRCWIRNCVGRGLWFNNCVMPTSDRNYITACGTASKAQVEYVSCTVSKHSQTYCSSGNAAAIGGLAIDKCTTFTADGGNCETPGIVLIDSQSNTTGSVAVTLRGIDLENPGNGNRYIDVGSGLSGGGHNVALDLQGWTGFPSGTTSQPSAVRLQNVLGARLRQANFSLAGAPTASYELASTTNSGVIIEAHPNLTGGSVPWVFINGAQNQTASPLVDFKQVDILGQGNYPVAGTISGATASLSVNAQGGIYRDLLVNNGGATTMTSLTGGVRGMKISMIAVNGNTTLTHSTVTANQWNLTLSGAVNLVMTANKPYVFEHNGTNWYQITN